MGVASLNGVPFRLDPQSIAWSYTVRTADMKTVGGRVVQILGATIDDMTVSGTFGKGGIKEQAAFLKRMQDLGNEQVVGAGIRNSTRSPIHFIYPPKKWDFLVYLKGFLEPRGSRSVHMTVGNFAPKWQLQFFVVEDNAGLKTIAKDLFISRLASGLGWKQSIYNGPMTMAEVMQATGNKDIASYLGEVFNVPATTPTAQGNE